MFTTTKSLTHGTMVMVTSRFARAIVPVQGNFSLEVDFVERNTGRPGSKITNTVHFTDGTQIRAAASDSWIVA